MFLLSSCTSYITAKHVYAKHFRCIYKTSWAKDNQLVLVMNEASLLAWKEFLNPILFLA